MAHDYLTRTGTWLKTANDDLKTVAQGLLEAAGSKFADGDYEEDAREIGERLEFDGEPPEDAEDEDPRG